MKIRKKVLIAAFSMVKRILTASKSNTSEKDNLLLKKKNEKKLVEYRQKYQPQVNRFIFVQFSSNLLSQELAHKDSKIIVCYVLSSRLGEISVYLMKFPYTCTANKKYPWV